MPRRVVPILLLALILIPLTNAFAQSSTVDSRDLTVYTRDVAEIQEVRTVDLKRGENALRLLDISPGILEGSVSIQAIDDEVTTESIAFTPNDFDLEAYWRARIGETIEIETKNGGKSSGVLRMVQKDKLFLQNMKHPEKLIVVDRDNIDETVLEDIPVQLATGPSLYWVCTAADKGETQIRISYLTEGLHWEGRHSVILTGAEGDVIAHAVVVNKTGMTLDYDSINFIGGDVHLAGDHRRVDRLNPKPGAMAGGTESSFGDMHRWTGEAGELLADHNTSVELLTDHVASVKRTYVYDATIFDDRISAHVKFDLTDALPAGDVSVYEDHDGNALFIGEDRIDDTPPGSMIDLNIGQVFDLTAERTRMEEGRAADGMTAQTYRVEIGNSGADQVTVRVLERLFGDWTIPNATLDGAQIKPIKVDARTAAFDVAVPAGKTVTLNYGIVYER